MTEHILLTENASVMGKFLDELQDKSTRLAGVLKAAAFLEGEGQCSDGRATLVYLAEELANDLTNALDLVNRPAKKVG